MATAYRYNPKTAKPYVTPDGREIAPPPVLTHDYLIRNEIPLWVLINTQPLGMMTLTIKSTTGDYMGLRIPKSKRPFCVTDQIASQDLARGGRDLWTAIQKQALVLVWPTDAVDMGGGSGEADQIMVSKWSAASAAAANEVVEAVKMDTVAESARSGVGGEGADEEEVQVHPKVMDITARVVAKEIKPDRAIEEYDTILEEVTDRDLKYAVANVTSGKLREWLQAKLASAVKAEKKKAKKASVVASPYGNQKDSVFDDDESDMTPEEREAERMRALIAQSKQKAFVR